MSKNQFIPYTVVNYVYNDNFILAVQNPTKKYSIGDFDFDYKGLEICFWIIDVQKDKILGPYSLDEYIKKRKALGVPEELKLKLEI